MRNTKVMVWLNLLQQKANGINNLKDERFIKILQTFHHFFTEHKTDIKKNGFEK